MSLRTVIEGSWRRTWATGINPDREVQAQVLEPGKLELRRRSTRLAQTLPVLRAAVLPHLDEARQFMAVAEADGRVLWREGGTAVLRQAEGYGVLPGPDWSKAVVGTNGIGTPLIARRPVRSPHWTGCAQRRHHNCG